MTKPQKHKVSIELGVEVVDDAALRAHVEALLREEYADDPDMLEDELGEARNGFVTALSCAFDPGLLAARVPGIKLIDSWSSVNPATDGSVDLGQLLRAGADGTTEIATEREQDTVNQILAMGRRAHIPALEEFAEEFAGEFEGGNPEAEMESPGASPMLAGALLWSYETVIDELFEDISMLRGGESAIDGTTRLAELPELYQSHYTALFAQRFLAVAMDLGTSLVSGFSSPTCVAQELALRLVLNGVEMLDDMYPELELPDDWRGMLEDLLFEDLDHEFLYDPSMDGISHDPAVAGLRMSDLDVSAWFAPFNGRAVNPYANEEGSDSL